MRCLREGKDDGNDEDEDEKFRKERDMKALIYMRLPQAEH